MTEEHETASTRIHVGTSGWSIASRYSNDAPAGGTHLERYARVFSIVEIDTSFNRHHQRSTYARWADSVGPDFRFAVKTPKALTHEAALTVRNSTGSGKGKGSSAGDVLCRFLEEIKGLGSKLSVLLVQLPPSLPFDESSVADFFQQLQIVVSPTVTLACEPRHPTWSAPPADALLRSLHVSRIAADPARWNADGSPGGDARVAYFRMHGSPKIYYSDYGADRLAALTRDLRNAARTSDSIWCIFDNTAHGHALGNALTVNRTIQDRDSGNRSVPGILDSDERRSRNLRAGEE